MGFGASGLSLKRHSQDRNQQPFFGIMLDDETRRRLFFDEPCQSLACVVRTSRSLHVFNLRVKAIRAIYRYLIYYYVVFDSIIFSKRYVILPEP